MVVLSVHTPKVAGTSLLAAFKLAYGEQAVLEDYADRPADPCSSFYLDPDGWRERRPTVLESGIQVIHGHFFPQKYDLIAPAFRTTFLRHPVSNLISIFFYWKKYVQYPSTGLYNYFVEQNLNVFELARLPLLRYLFSKTYFGGYDMGRFDFVGCHERREDSFRRLSRMLGVELDTLVWCNETDSGGKSRERLELENDRSNIAKLEDILSDDIRFYEKYVRD